MRQGPPLEAALVRALRWTLWAAPLSVVLLVIPSPTPRSVFAISIVHLSALVVLGLVVARDLSGFLDSEWFLGLGPTGRRIAAGASVVALTVGVVALVTLASSAALRFEPSMQFLQLLSAMDIAFAAGTTMVGVSWMRGRRAGDVAGLVVAVVCVWSIWNYLRIVGFTPDAGWLVDGDALMRYVLPYDVGAVVAVVSLTLGARRAAMLTPA